jgi:hypothetical protein
MPQTKSARYSLEMLKRAPASSSVASTGFRRPVWVIQFVFPIRCRGSEQALSYTECKRVSSVIPI